jgi:hypothetical protein
MYGFPIEWVACVTATDDDAHAAYVDSMHQCAQAAEQALAAASEAVQYECCGFSWWQHQDEVPLGCMHCGHWPRPVPPADTTGYGLFECPRCRWAWTSQQPHCRVGVTQSACVQCDSGGAVMVAVGPADMRSAFLEWHWARRTLRRLTGSAHQLPAPKECVPVARTCPVCSHRALYSNPVARRCCHCHVFARSAALLAP